MVDGQDRHATIRHVDCEILLIREESSCSSCTKNHNTLRALVSKKRIAISLRPSTHTNTWFLKTPQRKAHLSILRR